MENQACTCGHIKIYQYLLLLPDYAITAGLFAIFPSIASFFLRQLAQRKGPSFGFDAGEVNGPEFTDKPSLGG